MQYSYSYASLGYKDHSEESKFRFHHVGLACDRLGPEIEAHHSLGFKTEGDMFHDPLQQINGLFMTNNGMRIELLEPIEEQSPLKSFLSSGIKMYHQCFETDDLYSSIRLLKSLGAKLISPPKPAFAFQGRSIAFLMLRTRMIVELIQA